MSSPGTWAGTAPIVFSYQWLACDSSGSGCNPIPGATGQVYRISSADVSVGSTLRVRVTATNVNGATNATSAPTQAVTGTTSCTYMLYPTIGIFPVIGGSGSVLVTIPPTCITTGSFYASSNDGWIHLTNGVPLSNGSVQYFGSSATVSYSVDPNPYDSTNVGTISIANKTFTVFQEGSASPALDLSQHGLTGSWYEPATSGQGIELELFASAIDAPDTAFLHGAWFTFDAGAAGGAERQRWYTFSGNAKRGNASIPVTIYQNTGGNFSTPPVTNSVVVGSGTLAFASCTSGTFNYNFTDGSNRAGSIPLTRLTANVTCASAAAAKATNPDFSYSGNWYNPTTSGQGFVVEVNPISRVLFLTWYTYAPNGQAAGAAGQRWYTGQAVYTPGSRSIALALYETKGGVFDQASPAPQTTPVGMATLTFANCGAASIAYAFTGGSSAGVQGIMNLSRVGPIPAGCSP